MNAPTRILPLLAASLLVCPLAALAADYHFSTSSGDDNTGFGTESSPWKTIAKANTLNLEPGDRLLFKAGETFSGTILLTQEDSGTPTTPVVVGSYGTGRARIEAGNVEGFKGQSVAGLVLRDLHFVGSGNTTNLKEGVVISNYDSPATKRVFLRLQNLEVEQFGADGVEIGSWNGSGWSDVRITDLHTHHNKGAGLFTFSELKTHSDNVYVGRSRAHHNGGDGLLVSGVDGALIEYSIAHDNGWNTNGRVGIWTYEANNVTIQHCEAYRNVTPAGSDGGGFDLDGGVTNSVMQYNYSHDNHGAGFGLYQYNGATAYSGNVVRYNISENDGRKNDYGGISVWSDNGATGGTQINGADVYNNIVFVSPVSGATSSPSAFVHKTARAVSNVRVRNNVFITTGGLRLLNVPASANGYLFQNNLYWTSGGAFALRWGGTTYTSLSQWLSAATTQERVGGGIVALNTDPKLNAAGQGGTLDNVDLLPMLQAYFPQPGSPLIDAGLNLQSLFGINPGALDYRSATNLFGPKYDIGAVETANLISNGTIEGGMTGWSNWGGTSAQTASPHWGLTALRTGTTAGGAGNFVTTAVAPGKTYRLLGWGRHTASGNTGYIGITFKKNGVEVVRESLTLTSTTWTQAMLEVQAPADFDQAYVWIWRDAGTGNFWADDFDLVEIQP